MNSTAAVEQLNITPVDFSYRMPVELFGTFDKETGKRLTNRICPVGQIKVLSDIYTFDVKKDGTHGICTRTISQFKRDLNMSESTIRRALKFSDGDYITCPDERKGAYRFDTDKYHLCGGHYRLEAWMTRPVPFECGILSLTNSEQAVAAFFNSECNRSPQEFSANDIAEKLDISLPKVQKAIDKLINKKIQLVYRTFKGVNGYKKSKYIINRKLFRKLNKAEAKAQKAKEKEQAKKQEAGKRNNSDEPSNSTSLNEAVEHEFYDRKNKREESAQRTLARAMADTGFSMATEELQRLAPKLAYAAVRNLPELSKLLFKEQELKDRRNSVLERLKISEAELSEEFYVLCPKCRDKLFLPNGGLCTCFVRGSP